MDPGWKKFGSGINIPDPQHCILYRYIISLYTYYWKRGSESARGRRAQWPFLHVNAPKKTSTRRLKPTCKHITMAVFRIDFYRIRIRLHTADVLYITFLILFKVGTVQFLNLLRICDILVRFRIRILLFSSVTFKMATEKNFVRFLLITFWSYIYIIFHA